MTMLRTLLRVLAAGLVVATANLASAQTEEPADGSGLAEIDLVDEEARGLFRAGAAAFDRGNFEDALEYFRRAHELSQRPTLLYNIAHAAERLRRDDEAMIAFQHYLDAVPDAANREAVEARIDVLRAAIDERSRRERAQRAARRSNIETQPAPQTETQSEGSSVWPIVITGLGVAVAAGSIPLFLVAQSNADDVDDAVMGTPWVDLQDSYDSSITLSTVAAIMLAAGGSIAVTGLVLWIVEASDDAPTSVALTPSGLQLSGSF